MPGTTTISTDQRQGLYELVRNHLGSVEDLWIALERSEDFEAAQRLAGEFSADFRLLEDIGWRPEEDREDFELTMPPAELADLLSRLRGEAEQLLTESPTERRAREEDERTNRRLTSGLAACGQILIGLGENGGQ